MKIEFAMQEEDFLAFQVYIASKSDAIRKKKLRGWALLSLISIALTYYNYSNENRFMAIYFLVATVFFVFFYPLYFHWRYKRHYRKHIRENYQERIGKRTSLEFTQGELVVSEQTGEGSLNISEINEVTELPEIFIMTMSNGVSLIIPKRELHNHAAFRTTLKENNILFCNESEWKWKWI